MKRLKNGSGRDRYDGNAARAMSVIGPFEDDPPNQPSHLRAMPNEQDERETTETLAPETDREGRDTKPPGADDAEAGRVAATMLPAAPSAPAPAPPEYWKAAYDKLVEIHEEQRKDREARAARDDALVSRLSAAAKEASDSSVAHLTTALGGIGESVERIANRLVKLEENDEAHARRLADGEERFASIEKQLADLKGLVTKLEADLAAAKAHDGPARPASPKAAEQA
jgi:hypothetical protein